MAWGLSQHAGLGAGTDGDGLEEAGKGALRTTAGSHTASLLCAVGQGGPRAAPA